jgi:hypothetical protein
LQEGPLKIPSNSSVTIKCKDTQHHRITGSFGFKDFDGTSEESAFWSKATEEQKQELKKKHVDTGVCLLCMIDDLLQKAPEPRRLVIETEQRASRTTTSTRDVIPSPSKKIAGGIIARGHERAEASSPNLKVSWEWYNEELGIIRWTLQNLGAQPSSAILFRNSYYFGNAYWPIYASNPGFGATFATNLESLSDKTIRSNSAPLGIVSWKQPDGSFKSIVAFVFTLSTGQSWQVLEAGFSNLKPPQNINIFEVSPVSESPADFVLAYDQEQVDSWNAQTGNLDKGYAPNPNVFNTVQVLAPPDAPFEQLFEGDSIHERGVETPKEEKLTKEEQALPRVEEEGEVEQQQPPPEQQEEAQEEAPIELEVSPSSTSGSGTKSLWSLLGKRSASSSSGTN